MNKDKIKKLITVLKEDTNYDQKQLFECDGSPLCIAGHTLVMEGWSAEDFGGISRFKDVENAWNTARDILGLTNKQSTWLFNPFPFFFFIFLKPVGKEDAIATLEHLLETGKVRWRRTKR